MKYHTLICSVVLLVVCVFCAGVLAACDADGSDPSESGTEALPDAQEIQTQIDAVKSAYEGGTIDFDTAMDRFVPIYSDIEKRKDESLLASAKRVQEEICRAAKAALEEATANGNAPEDYEAQMSKIRRYLQGFISDEQIERSEAK